ncbi:MAG: D-alanyl-D-alanine carboxypeptidase family protein [Lachnospiraceae bacterium]|nr:D-alanyl-D-alanine carboxypeptidase family protein [Lachnospiraceae bacterium]
MKYKSRNKHIKGRPGRIIVAFLSAVLVSALAASSVFAAEAGAADAASAAETPAPSGADPSIVITNGTPGWPQAQDIFSDAGVLIDADTGTVLFDKCMDVQKYPASVTKLMTVLLALENGNLEDQVAMTSTGTAYVADGSSNLYTQVGEVFTLEQLLYGTMLKSANDMATQVGEYIGGTLENFIQMMNDRAVSLGCTGTHFENACGMPNEAHMTTAHDLALIARQALQYEKFREIVHTANYTIPPTNMTATERTMTNHNALLVVPEFFYPGIIGGKTGYTDAAQSCLANFASREGMTLIVVTLHAMDGSYAAQDNVDLLDYGYNNFKLVDIGIPEYISSGGKIMIPSNANVTDCAVEVQESVAADGTEMTDYVYSYGGRRVGNMLMTEENAKAYEKFLKDEEKKKEKEKKKGSKSGKKEKAAVEKTEQDKEGDETASPDSSGANAGGTETAVTAGTQAYGGDSSGALEQETDLAAKRKKMEIRIIIGIVLFMAIFVAIMILALNYERNKKRIRKKKRKKRK